MSESKTKIKVGAEKTGVTRTKTFRATKSIPTGTTRSETLVGKIKTSMGGEKKKRLVPYIMVLLIFYLALEIIFPEQDDVKVINPPGNQVKKIPPKPQKSIEEKIRAEGEVVSEENKQNPLEEKLEEGIDRDKKEEMVVKNEEVPKLEESNQLDTINATENTTEASVGEKKAIPVEQQPIQTPAMAEQSLEDTTKNDLEKLEEKIEESLSVAEGEEQIMGNPQKEFPIPPDYENTGRGLVYNCKGGHWACVDKPSYFQCLENKRWSEEGGKTPSCVEFNVYATNKDCELAQIYNVNTVKQVYSCLN